MTLDEWSESTKEHKLLKSNLKINLKMMVGEHLDEEELESLLRLNLIMVRQFEEDSK
jgi:hypothetical protein